MESEWELGGERQEQTLETPLAKEILLEEEGEGREPLQGSPSDTAFCRDDNFL